MFLSKDDIRDAIKAEAERCKEIADLAKRKIEEGGDEAERYKLTHKTFMRKYRLLGDLFKRVNQISFEELETDLANIINSI